MILSHFKMIQIWEVGNDPSIIPRANWARLNGFLYTFCHQDQMLSMIPLIPGSGTDPDY